MPITTSRLGGIALALALFVGSVPAHAHGFKAGDLEIAHPWTRATPGGARVGVGYVKAIRNAGTAPDRLVAVESPVSPRVEIHESREVDGVAQMRPVAAVEIPAGGEVALAPGGYHLMLTGLSAPFVQGQSVPATLVFERAGRVAVELSVETMGGAPAHKSHH
jgi:periplasmic copper chaperone A